MKRTLTQIEQMSARIIELVRIREEALLELTELITLPDDGIARGPGGGGNGVIVKRYSAVVQTKDANWSGGTGGPTADDHVVMDENRKPLRVAKDSCTKVAESMRESFVAGPCTKCERVARGGDGRGRHNKGCVKAAGPVIETAKEPVPEMPLGGIEADYRSRCCDARLLVAGGGEGTNHYECSKCYNACDAYQPVPEDMQRYECDGCGHAFNADRSDVVVCPECKSTNVWPAKT